MIPLYFKQRSLSLIIFPDTQAHLNGHTIITHAYSIYNYTSGIDPARVIRRKSTPTLVNNDNPDYFGQITFELPDRVFTYSAGTFCSLDTDQIEQVIEFISDFRNNPTLWQNLEL